MSVHNVIKEVFLVLMCAMLLALLYELFFSTEDDGFINAEGISGVSKNQTIGDEHIMGAGDGIADGALWFASYQIQKPIARYYYDYCYLPNIHAEDATDAELGVDNIYSGVDMFTTPSDLSNGKQLNNNGSVGSSYYDTGWQ